MQSLDPIGIAARDLVECLLLQLKPSSLAGTATETIIREHLELLKRWKIDEIAKKMGLSTQKVLEHVEVVKHLDPKPGSKYSNQSSQYVAPDVYVCEGRRRVQGAGQ